MGGFDSIDVAGILRRRPGSFSGGARPIPSETAYGSFNVCSKRSGNNPRTKVLLYGGPGGTSEYFECFDDYPPQAGIEYCHYDRLGSQRMQAMARAFPHGRCLHCPNGSHLAMYDDQITYVSDLLDFLRDVDVADRG